MGLLDNQTQNAYYTGSDFGTYQFVTLDHIINGFMVAYVGESKVISKINRTDVQFHAMRAIQELSYDVFRSIKSQEIEVPATLTMVLPQDYVNYVKLVKIDSNGVERVLYPTGKTSNPFAISQDTDGNYQFTGNNLTEQSPSNTWDSYKDQTETDVYTDDSTDIDIDFRGRRYGLNPENAQSNGTFFIDYLRGYIHFGSALAGDTIILKYISDGLGTDAEMVVHKFCEEACYKWIAHGVLSTRSNIPEYLVQRFKKERFAESRKAKIRLSNIKIEEFTQVLKGLSKPIK
tara:strand:+ start:36 stop:902 length:867 start_codon:yes stop_codon:yes gene_type:complete